MIDALGVASKGLPGLIQLSVVAEVMNSDFESARPKLNPVLCGDPILSLWDEVKGGPKAEGLFDGGDGHAIPEALGAFDVMGQNDGELLSAGPSAPVDGCSPRRLVDGPIGVRTAECSK